MNKMYTDGSVRGNPGPGGWAYVIYMEDGTEIKNSGMAPSITTNNAMEIEAVYQGLEHAILLGIKEITVFTDSQLVIGWLQSGWKCTKEHIRVIRDRVNELVRRNHMRVFYQKVEGHAGIEGNETADNMAAHESLKSNLRMAAKSEGYNLPKEPVKQLTIPQRPPQQDSNSVAIWPLVIKDMGSRDDFGRKKYGQPLVHNDGRDTLVDAYQEALDLCVYLRKLIYERDGK